MSTNRGALETAFARETGEPDTDAAGLAEQLDLLRDDDGKLPDNVFLLERDAQATARRGRKAGTPNKRNVAIAKAICEVGGDPVLFLARVYSQPLDQMVEKLRIADNSREREQQLFDLIERVEGSIARLAQQGISAKQMRTIDGLVSKLVDVAKLLQFKPGDLAAKALALQISAAKEAGLYVHSKKPIEVDHRRRADVVLNIPGLTDPAELADFVESPELREEDLARIEFLPFDASDGAPIEQVEGELIERGAA